MKKKILLTLFCLFILVGLTGCGNNIDYYEKNDHIPVVDSVIPNAELIKTDGDCYLYYLSDEDDIAYQYFSQYISFINKQENLESEYYTTFVKNNNISGTTYNINYRSISIATCDFYNDDESWFIELILK